MITLWPRVRDICSPISRATVSVPPPAAKGTTSVTVFGAGCARAGGENAESRRAKLARVILQRRAITGASSKLILHQVAGPDASVYPSRRFCSIVLGRANGRNLCADAPVDTIGRQTEPTTYHADRSRRTITRTHCLQYHQPARQRARLHS